LQIAPPKCCPSSQKDMHFLQWAESLTVSLLSKLAAQTASLLWNSGRTNSVFWHVAWGHLAACKGWLPHCSCSNATNEENIECNWILNWINQSIEEAKQE
jgi:hypothetical protein